MTYEEFVLEYTKRDMDYHRRYGTTGIEFGRECWEKATNQSRADLDRLHRERDAFQEQCRVMAEENARYLNMLVYWSNDMTGNINSPAHYTSHRSGIECIELTRHMGFCRGNALKYIWRAELEGATVEDFDKAIWYLKDVMKNSIVAIYDADVREELNCLLDQLWEADFSAFDVDRRDIVFAEPMMMRRVIQSIECAKSHVLDGELMHHPV